MLLWRLRPSSSSLTRPRWISDGLARRAHFQLPSKLPFGWRLHARLIERPKLRLPGGRPKSSSLINLKRPCWAPFKGPSNLCNLHLCNRRLGICASVASRLRSFIALRSALLLFTAPQETQRIRHLRMMPALWLLTERPGMFATLESSKRMPSRQHEQACYCKKRQLCDANPRT